MIELTEKQKQTQNAGIIVDIDKLHQVSEPIGEIEDTELFKVVDKLEKQLVANRALGVAGVQIDYPFQIFVMMTIDGVETVINPEIVSEYWQKEYFTEGCLSFPDEFVLVGRPKKVNVKYKTIRNKEIEDVEKSFSGLEARIFFHEIFHLRGITIKDIG